MEITREMLEERRAQLLADFNALNGAIQQVEWTLEKLDEAAVDETAAAPITLEVSDGS